MSVLTKHSALHNNTFKDWCSLKYQGVRDIRFENHTPRNYSYASNNQWIIARHHPVKQFIANLLREKCFEEVYGVNSDGKSTFNDIIAYVAYKTCGEMRDNI